MSDIVATPSQEAEVDPPTPLPSQSDRSNPIRSSARSAGAVTKAPQSRARKLVLFALIPYAVLTTVLTIYGLFLKSNGRALEGHPLSTIPDNYGEFPPADRKKVVKTIVPLDQALPNDAKVALGGTLSVGALEVEPMLVETRPLKIVRVGKAGSERVERVTATAVVLHIKIRNTSDDTTLCPVDPAFNRKRHLPDQPATGLITAQQSFWGGAIGWPFPANVQREYESGQEGDATPLKPHESREYVVFSDADPGVVKAVQNAKESLLWRVQLRRGLVDYRGKDVPVTAIIGIEFKSSDVKAAD